jgi:hypothetical protein
MSSLVPLITGTWAVTVWTWAIAPAGTIAAQSASAVSILLRMGFLPNNKAIAANLDQQRWPEYERNVAP